MQKLISAEHLTSVIDHTGGCLTCGRSVTNMGLKKSKYLKGFQMKGGFLRSGTEVRPIQSHYSRKTIKPRGRTRRNHKQNGGFIRGGTEVRPLRGAQTGGFIRGGTEVRPLRGSQSGAGKKRTTKSKRKMTKRKSH